MVADARANTKTYLETYLTPANITKDDGSSNAGFEVMYDKPDYPLTLEFKAPSVVDVIFSIGKPNSTPMMDPLTQAPYGYTEHMPITIMAVDKTGVTGTLVVWKAEAELRRVAETYPSGSRRSLDRVRDTEQNLGSTKLYSTEFILNYRRDTT